MNTALRIVKVENAYIVGVQSADGTVKEWIAPDGKALLKLVSEHGKTLKKPSEIVTQPLSPDDIPEDLGFTDEDL